MGELKTLTKSLLITILISLGIFVMDNITEIILGVFSIEVYYATLTSKGTLNESFISQ